MGGVLLAAAGAAPRHSRPRAPAGYGDGEPSKTIGGSNASLGLRRPLRLHRGVKTKNAIRKVSDAGIDHSGRNMASHFTFSVKTNITRPSSETMFGQRLMVTPTVNNFARRRSAMWLTLSRLRCADALRQMCPPIAYAAQQNRRIAKMLVSLVQPAAAACQLIFAVFTAETTAARGCFRPLSSNDQWTL